MVQHQIQNFTFKLFISKYTPNHPNIYKKARNVDMWCELRAFWLLETWTRYLGSNHNTQPKYSLRVYPALDVLFGMAVRSLFKLNRNFLRSINYCTFEGNKATRILSHVLDKIYPHGLYRSYICKVYGLLRLFPNAGFPKLPSLVTFLRGQFLTWKVTLVKKR